jgi:hypothetical protein
MKKALFLFVLSILAWGSAQTHVELILDASG